MKNYYNEPMAIRKEALAVLATESLSALQSLQEKKTEIASALQIKTESNFSEKYGISVKSTVAIIPILGCLQQRPDIVSQFFGWTTYEQCKAQLLIAMQDEEVARIILDIDSPGGSIYGVADLAEMIYVAREKKPIIACVNNFAASAAYWIASACSEVVLASEASLTGSIGVVAIHKDVSKFEEKIGIKTTEITAGKYKRAVSNYEPLDKTGRDMLQEQVDKFYSIFVDAVAKYRGVSSASVLERMADGKDFIGIDGINAGLANRVESLESLLSHQAYNSGETPQTTEGQNMPTATKIRAGMPGDEEEKKKKDDAKAEEEKDEKGAMDDTDETKTEDAPSDEEEKKKKDEDDDESYVRGKHASAVKKIESAAKKKERERICAIDDLPAPGYEKLKQEAKQSGWSAEKTAYKIMQAQNKSGVSLSALRNESQSVAHAAFSEKYGNEDLQAAIRNAKIVNDSRRRS